MTPQARIKARFAEDAAAAGVILTISARKSTATLSTEHVFDGRIYYATIRGDYDARQKFIRAAMLKLGSTSGTWAEATYSMEPKDIARVLAETQVNSNWLHANDDAALRIAKAIRTNQSFEDLPVLADALEEAGCDNEHILRHCRADAKHAGACWVIEVLVAEGRESQKKSEPS